MTIDPKSLDLLEKAVDLTATLAEKVFCPTGSGGGVDPTCRRGDGFGVHGPGITNRTKPPKKPASSGGGGGSSSSSSSGGGGGASKPKASVEQRTKTAKAAARAMPSNSRISERDDHINVSWSKRGGHAGLNSIKKTKAKLKEMGFEYDNSSSSGSPDGSYVGGGERLKHPDGHTFEYSTNYGPTAAYNSYRMNLKLVRPTPEFSLAKKPKAAGSASGKKPAASTSKPKTKEEQFKDWSRKESMKAAETDLKKVSRRRFKKETSRSGTVTLTSKQAGAMEVVSQLERSGWKSFTPNYGQQSRVNFYLAKAANFINVMGEYSGGVRISSADPHTAKFDWKPPS